VSIPLDLLLLSFESRRRRSANTRSLVNASLANLSPANIKRVARDDDLDVLLKSPRKDHTHQVFSRGPV
jgi:DTW domain-containing protein YfiP